MHITIVAGSHSEDSQSLKVSQWLSQAIENKDGGHSVDLINLGGNPIPLWDKAAWNKNSELSALVSPYLDKVSKADGLILVSPEWGGMAPAGLKNFLLYIGGQHSAHKPAMITSVSSGCGGAYPVAELRMSGFKNNRIVYTPEHLIVQDALNVMNDHDLENGAENDVYIKNRAHYSLDVLLAYAEAMKTMRSETDLIDKKYPYGM